MGISTKFQPMGYQPNKYVGNIKQIFTTGQGSTPSVFVLDRDGVVWLYASPFYMSYAPDWSNSLSGKFTRIFRNVKKICKQVRAGQNDFGIFMFITNDNKLMYWGKGGYIGYEDTGLIDNSKPLVELLSNVKDAWVLKRCGNDQTNQKVTFYALTNDYKLYARGNNDNNVFGDGGTSSSTQEWVLVKEGVKKFFIAPEFNNGSNITLVIETIYHTVEVANLSVTANMFGTSYSDTYTSFRQITTPPTTYDSYGAITGVDFIVSPINFKYTLLSSGSSPSTTNIKSIGIVQGGVLYADRGYGFGKYLELSDYIKGLVNHPYGFIFADNDGLKYWTNNNVQPFPAYTSNPTNGTNYSETQSIFAQPVQTKSEANIKALYVTDNHDYNSFAYITANNELYMGYGGYASIFNNSDFSKVDEDVVCVGEGRYPYWAWATSDGELFWRRNDGYNSTTITQLPSLDPTNTGWLN